MSIAEKINALKNNGILHIMGNDGTILNDKEVMYKIFLNVICVLEDEADMLCDVCGDRYYDDADKRMCHYCLVKRGEK